MVIFDKHFGGLRTKRQERAVFPELPEFANHLISAYAFGRRPTFQTRDVADMKH